TEPLNPSQSSPTGLSSPDFFAGRDNRPRQDPRASLAYRANLVDPSNRERLVRKRVARGGADGGWMAWRGTYCSANGGDPQQGRMMTRHRATTTATLVLALTLTAPAVAGANSLLSGYGGPGEGNQAILGSALLGGPGSGGGGSSSGGSSGQSGSGGSAPPARSAVARRALVAGPMRPRAPRRPAGTHPPPALVRMNTHRVRPKADP